MILPYSLGREGKIQHRKSGLNITIYLLFSSFLENRSINLLAITAVIDDLWNRFRDYLERVDFEIDLTINLTHKYIPRCRSISFLYFAIFWKIKARFEIRVFIVASPGKIPNSIDPFLRRWRRRFLDWSQDSGNRCGDYREPMEPINEAWVNARRHSLHVCVSVRSRAGKTRGEVIRARRGEGVGEKTEESSGQR